MDLLQVCCETASASGSLPWLMPSDTMKTGLRTRFTIPVSMPAPVGGGSFRDLRRDGLGERCGG